jgi:hypothetical protein
MPEIQTAVGMGLIMIERTERARRISARRLNLHNVRASPSQELTTELTFLISKFEHFHIEKEPVHSCFPHFVALRAILCIFSDD